MAPDRYRRRGRPPTPRLIPPAPPLAAQIAHERAVTTEQKVEFIFWAVLRLQERDEERTQAGDLLAERLDQVRGQLAAASAERQALAHEQMRLVGEVLADLAELRGAVLGSDQYSAQAIEALDRLRRSVHDMQAWMCDHLEQPARALGEASPAAPPVVLIRREQRSTG